MEPELISDLLNWIERNKKGHFYYTKGGGNVGVRSEHAVDVNNVKHTVYLPFSRTFDILLFWCHFNGQ